MKLTECTSCALSSKRKGFSFSKGIKPASVMILFEREAQTEEAQRQVEEFLRELNVYLKRDVYWGYVVKCLCPDEKIGPEVVKACRKWVENELKMVQPYLIIMMGKIPAITLMGGKYYKLLIENVFYTLEKEGEKKQYFLGCEMGDGEKLKETLKVLITFIKGYYNGN